MADEQNQPFYVMAEIRQLIMNSFNDDEFTSFCFDFFRPVYEDFAGGQNFTQRVMSLLDYCLRRLLIPELLARIKEVNPAQYNRFISVLSHSAIGIDQAAIPQADMPFSVLQREFTQRQKEIPAVTVGQDEGFHDFQFQNRDDLREKILNGNANHIELYGPSGAGKTYLLRHLNKNHPEVFLCYINLARGITIEKLQEKILSQLDTDSSNLAVSILNLHNSNPGFSHFIFLFDSANEEHEQIINWLISETGLINQRKFLDSLKALGIRRDDVKFQVVIATRRPVVKIESYHPNLHFESMAIDRLKPTPAPDDDPIQNMLRELATHKNFPIAQSACSQIGREIYYLTGGHPKCVKLLLLAVADADFVPTNQQWNNFFLNRVLPVVKEEMLSNISELDLLPVLWVLSVFRRFDSTLLRALLEKNILLSPSSDVDVSRRVRQLRNQLVATYLVSKPTLDERLCKIDFTLRRALSVSMQHQSAERYRALNSAAIEIFGDWLYSLKTTSEKAIISLLELMYHWLKLLEEDSSVDKADICGRLQKALNQYLPLLLPIFDREDTMLRQELLDFFLVSWEADEEFKEHLERATGNSACHKSLTNTVNAFIAQYRDEV